MNVKRLVVFGLVIFSIGFLTACSGPVHMAKTEAEGLKTTYQDPDLAAMSRNSSELFKEIYARYTSKRMYIAKEGLGFTSLNDDHGRKQFYLLVEAHHEDCNFNKNATTGRERLQAVLQNYFESDLRVLNRQDVARNDISGLAFGVTWAVRDFYQCDKYGGFVEYVIAYINKDDFYSILDRSKSVATVLADSEVITSLDLQPPTSIKLKYQ
jgi:hypothetical protein